MKKSVRYILPFFCAILLAMSAFSIKTLLSIRAEGKLINYVGIVRGASQRLVKLELERRPNDELIAYLDGILDELVNGEGQYGLISLNGKDYQEKLKTLYTAWDGLKEEIQAVRGGKDVKQLLDMSEDYFELANDTVFAAESYSNMQSTGLLVLIPDGYIEVEFTENVAFEQTDILLDIVRELKDEGFACSLDDFGKGYSSLNMLKSLPVDVLKLDKMFFDEDGDQEKARTVIEDIIQMVRDLNILTVAEGIESREQVEFLKSIGCDQIQGYVFYRPMPIEEYENCLLRQNGPGRV